LSATARVEAFSDGVFAIAITLLILDLHVPDATPAGTLAGALAHQWPSYVAYVMSFSVILVMWVNHHRIFSLLSRADHPLLYWNGLLLMLISIVPFPTALLAKYPGTRLAAGIYAAHGLLIALAFTALWRYAIRGGHLLHPHHDRAEVARMSRQYRYGPLAYLAACLLVFVHPYATIALCLALALFFAFRGFVVKD